MWDSWLRRDSLKAFGRAFGKPSSLFIRQLAQCCVDRLRPPRSLFHQRGFIDTHAPLFWPKFDRGLRCLYRRAREAEVRKAPRHKIAVDSAPAVRRWRDRRPCLRERLDGQRNRLSLSKRPSTRARNNVIGPARRLVRCSDMSGFGGEAEVRAAPSNRRE